MSRALAPPSRQSGTAWTLLPFLFLLALARSSAWATSALLVCARPSAPTTPTMLADASEPSASAPGEQRLLELRQADEPSGPPRSLEVGGASVTMEELGPIVVGADGSLSRIANWEEMTAPEQEVAKRRIVARNVRRLTALRAEAAPNAEQSS
mmetsp:Transcript_15396/g.39049  ORF Transcript_15396/g.39049 Transcript_15396/m.39049 type:complete len:153 (+) Transcript_15396:164-622(+)|eukprot:CAMPEP_0179886432 /NCGR_PEP_ID=MMETSP0982-20121206/30842_1 /TAXON_ID=483367 /ORGANISM="non described non described, Strain CCMP 2436" /LENGTH=152 /DNA_ID=CAMNT_0021782141 /DNA_START=218 /DNA_END=676 /DNA_ORIENTATION=-